MARRGSIALDGRSIAGPNCATVVTIERHFAPAYYAHALVSDLKRCAAQAPSLDSIANMLDGFVRDLGFRYHALVHHGNPLEAAPRRLRLDNYPTPWVAQFVQNGLFRNDPVQRACLRTGQGFAWEKMTEFYTLSRDQIATLEYSIKAGLGAGYTVSLPMIGQPPASCSFVTRPGAPYPERAQDAAQLGARIAFEAALHLLLATRKTRGSRLTPRQRDCVELVAQGKTDWEIGVVLGLSEETATKYVNAARRRYGVARRNQLPIAAYLDGEIDLCDIALFH